MIRSHTRMLAVAVCLVRVSCSHDVAAKEPIDDPKVIEGLWSGSWGGMVGAGGAVHQPVMAELFIKGNHVEVYDLFAQAPRCTEAVGKCTGGTCYGSWDQ